MFTVALIGPDGAGKSTISRRLERELPFRARAVYMGVNLDVAGPMLPTTRLVLELKRARGQRPDMVASSAGRGRARSVKSGARLVLWLAEEWFRQLVAAYHTRRGTVVLFDRHFYADYYHDDVAANGSRSLSRRIHGFVLRRLYPRPDLAVCLDAPGAILYARKGEASPEWLERRRGEYLELAAQLPAFAVVDAARELDEVVRDVAEIVSDFRRSRLRPASLPSARERPTTESTP